MDRNCAISNAMGFIGKRWSLLILMELYKGNSSWKRFSVIKKRLEGITPKILSARLKELEAEGLIIRRVNADKFPIKSEYRLTESGEQFIEVPRALKKWSLRWKVKSRPCTLDCKYCDRSL